jgi:hypothetical protein
MQETMQENNKVEKGNLRDPKILNFAFFRLLSSLKRNSLSNKKWENSEYASFECRFRITRQKRWLKLQTLKKLMTSM